MSQDLSVSVWIGKRGVSEAQLKEIRDQLRTKKLIKIKALKSAVGERTVRELAALIAEQTGSRAESVVGLTFVLRRVR